MKPRETRTWLGQHSSCIVIFETSQNQLKSSSFSQLNIRKKNTSKTAHSTNKCLHQCQTDWRKRKGSNNNLIWFKSFCAWLVKDLSISSLEEGENKAMITKKQEKRCQTETSKNQMHGWNFLSSSAVNRTIENVASTKQNPFLSNALKEMQSWTNHNKPYRSPSQTKQHKEQTTRTRTNIGLTTQK